MLNLNKLQTNLLAYGSAVPPEIVIQLAEKLLAGGSASPTCVP